MRIVRWMLIFALALCSGCSLFARTVAGPFRSIKGEFQEHKPNYWERYGKVYFLDGAGSLGFGQDIPRALRSAGYRGDVENITWTTHTGPLGDQMIRVNARMRSDSLAKRIRDYHRRYPNAPIYIIGLSAGTGVGVWAVENLHEDIKIDGMVLLGSSLSTHYDITRCLRHITNKVFVFYSPHDAVLRSFIPITGTIDGAFFTDPAGLAGLFPPRKTSRDKMNLYKEKLVNVAWRPSFERLGYAGGHTDATSYAFVKYYIAKKLKIGRSGETAGLDGPADETSSPGETRDEMR